MGQDALMALAVAPIFLLLRTGLRTREDGLVGVTGLNRRPVLASTYEGSPR